jgi:hypothetical protein
MYQVTFSEQAMHELNGLDKLAQLDVLEPMTSIRRTTSPSPRTARPVSPRPKGILPPACRRFPFLFRSCTGEALHVDYILHKNSLEDFLLRNKLPVSEQQLVEQHSKFWKYLESLTKRRISVAAPPPNAPPTNWPAAKTPIPSPTRAASTSCRIS